MRKRSTGFKFYALIICIIFQEVYPWHFLRYPSLLVGKGILEWEEFCKFSLHEKKTEISIRQFEST